MLSPEPDSSILSLPWLSKQAATEIDASPCWSLVFTEILQMSDAFLNPLPEGGPDLWVWFARAWWLWGIIAPRFQKWLDSRRAGRHPAVGRPPSCPPARRSVRRRYAAPRRPRR